MLSYGTSQRNQAGAQSGARSRLGPFPKVASRVASRLSPRPVAPWWCPRLGGPLGAPALVPCLVAPLSATAWYSRWCPRLVPPTGAPAWCPRLVPPSGGQLGGLLGGQLLSRAPAGARPSVLAIRTIENPLSHSLLGVSVRCPRLVPPTGAPKRGATRGATGGGNF